MVGDIGLAGGGEHGGFLAWEVGEEGPGGGVAGVVGGGTDGFGEDSVGDSGVVGVDAVVEGAFCGGDAGVGGG